MFNNEIFNNIGHDNEIVSPKEMKENLELIKSQIINFKNKFTEISKNKLEINNHDVDRIIKETLEVSNLNEKDARIMNGFYETWMSIFMMVGSDREALEIVFKMIHSQE